VAKPAEIADVYRPKLDYGAVDFVVSVTVRLRLTDDPRCFQHPGCHSQPFQPMHGGPSLSGSEEDRLEVPTDCAMPGQASRNR
jgi:hypothetical protein